MKSAIIISLVSATILILIASAAEIRTLKSKVERMESRPAAKLAIELVKEREDHKNTAMELQRLRASIGGDWPIKL